MSERSAGRLHTNQRTALTAVRTRQYFRKNQKRTTVFHILINDLICFSQAHFLFCLRSFQRAKIGEKDAIRIKTSRACVRFWCVKVILTLTLANHSNFPCFKIHILPRKSKNLTDTHPCMIQDLDGGVVSAVRWDGGELFRCNHLARRTAGDG